MKQVFIEYGGAVIAVIGALSFFVIFNQFFVGEEGVLGQLFAHSIDEKTMVEHEDFDEYKKDVPPTIALKGVNTLVANQRVNLSDCFEATSASGELLPVYLMGAWDLDGNEKNIGASEDKKSICVSQAGIYMIQIYAVDSSGKATSRMHKLLVNER